MRGLIGIVVSFILIIVLISWLRLEGSKLITPNLRNTFSGLSGSTSTQQTDNSTTPSSYVGRVVISSVSLGAYRSVSIQNNGVAQIPLSTWRLVAKKGSTSLPRGSTRANIAAAPTPILLAAGQTAVVFEGAFNEQAISVRPNADWYAWTGNQFLEKEDELILYDEKNREVATFSY